MKFGHPTFPVNCPRTQRTTTMAKSQYNMTRLLTARQGFVARGLLAMTLIWLGTGTTVSAQAPDVHYQHAGILAPGAIGSAQLLRGGPLAGYFQPVEIQAPSGAWISLAIDQQFQQPKAGPVRAGLLIGAVYRLRVTNIPQHEGLEVFPSIELVNRLYPPPGQETRFPIPIELAEEDLVLALQGNFITRIIYLEDPKNALPVAQDPQRQSRYEVEAHDDPLAVADRLGRPMAILRLGGRLPDRVGNDGAFFFNSPPLVPLETPKKAPPPENPKQAAAGLQRVATPAIPRTPESFQR